MSTAKSGVEDPSPKAGQGLTHVDIGRGSRQGVSPGLAAEGHNVAAALQNAKNLRDVGA